MGDFIRLGYVRGPVANHQDYYVFSEVHAQSGKKINVAGCSKAGGPSFGSWDYSKIEFVNYQDETQLYDRFDILDTSEFYRDYSRDILANFDGKRVVTVFDNLPFGISRGGAGTYSLHADKVIARSPMIRDMLLLEGVPGEKIVIVPSAVDVQKFKPGIFNSNIPTVLFVGRLVPEKGLWDLIIAMSGLGLDLLVAGGGDTGPYQNLANDCGVTVRFLGEVSNDNLPRIMHQASMLVAPSIPVININNPEGSWVEQFGVVLLEAMASGLPVIVSDTGSTRDIITEDVGFLFPPRSWNILRYQIETLAKNYGLRNKLGSNGRSRAERLFSTQVVGAQLAKVYLSL